MVSVVVRREREDGLGGRQGGLSTEEEEEPGQVGFCAALGDLLGC